MSEYVIITDSSCDITQEMADQLGLRVLPLTAIAPDGEYMNYLDGREISFDEFYKRMRAGELWKSSAVNTAAFEVVMKEILDEGKDVLYLGFSSGLSATYASGEAAAEELRPKYPDRKILTVDTLCASMGQGLMIYLAAQKKQAGASIEEVRDYVEENKLHLCHWFTVDDLQFLRRGGRVSGAAAVIGTMLQIKPVLHVDNEGKLIPMSKARGRKAALNALVERMEQLTIDPAEQKVFISHGDCLADAQYVAERIRQKIGVTSEICINFIGPVVGAHAGPGTVALFFLGKER